ncbi:MAG: ABC transporter substrate-binding protein [Candidatus Peribacteria bacterium]|jgi:branched-chain amino acid transport system substrate-binding protein|nr:ABC transporter substrate-binding protein [Candidatus Peribacteria bacterium]
MQKLLTSLLGIFLLASVAGCTTQQTENEQTVQVVKIGVIAPLSGPASGYGEDAVNAYTYLTNQFNASQTDIHIELIIEDGKCEGRDSTSAVQKLINVDQVQVIVGGICSSETIAAGKIAQQYGIPMISPISSSPEVSTIGAYVFRFFNDNDITKILARHLEKMHIDTVVLVAEQSDVGI